MGVKRWKVKRGHEENHEAEAINSAGQEKNGKDAEEEKAVCFNGYDATSTTTASRPNPASRPNRSIWQWHAARTDSRRAKARNIARWVLPQSALTAAGATMPASAHSGTPTGMEWEPALDLRERTLEWQRGGQYVGHERWN